MKIQPFGLPCFEIILNEDFLKPTIRFLTAHPQGRHTAYSYALAYG
jgi:hypothetical protein